MRRSRWVPFATRSHPSCESALTLISQIAGRVKRALSRSFGGRLGMRFGRGRRRPAGRVRRASTYAKLGPWSRPPRPSPVAASERYEAVIGIEVHCQLRTASKMFCGCSTAYDGAAPNSHVCPVCLGPAGRPAGHQPAGRRARPRDRARRSRRPCPAATRWDRKNYFYPDLPKGYQISQYDLPLASLGRLAFETSDGPFTVEITRAHLEEDTAKLVHAPARTVDGSAWSTSTGRARRSWRSSPSRSSGPPSRPVGTPRSCSSSSGRSGRPTRTWSAARCGSRRTSRSGRAARSRSGRGSRSRT